MPAYRNVFPVFMMIAVTAVWGWTFVVVRDAVHDYPVLPFLALRFVLASVALVPILLWPGQGFRAGLVPGIALSLGYLCQTVGLEFTTASRAGLLTGLFVVFTPVLEFMVIRVRPRRLTWAAVLAGLIGTALLTSGSSAFAVDTREVLGDGLEILTAICFSVHILLLGRVSRSADVSRVALAQMFVGGFAFTVASPLTGGVPLPSRGVWSALVITSLLASAVAFWVQSYVQQRISATRTAVLLVAEPAFATLFGVLLAGDAFTVVQACGAGLILIALVAHEAGPLLWPGFESQSAVT